MGQKTNPKALRLGIIQNWEANWYAESSYSDFVYQDYQVRNFLKNELKKAGISKIEINRKSGFTEAKVSISRMGIVMGKRGVDIELLSKQLSKKIGAKLRINIVEEKAPDVNSRLLSEWICAQLEGRVAFRRAMRQAVQRALKSGALGIKIACSGRLGGLEIARTEWYREGKVPLHTIRADIDYAFSEALTTYGKIGVKVWVYKGEVHEKSYQREPQPVQAKKKGK